MGSCSQQKAIIQLKFVAENLFFALAADVIESKLSFCAVLRVGCICWDCKNVFHSALVVGVLLWLLVSQNGIRSCSLLL